MAKTERFGLNNYAPGDSINTSTFNEDHQLLDKWAAKLSEEGAESWDSGNLKVEQGVWTPILIGGTVDGTPLYVINEGIYTRQGSFVYCIGSLVISSKGGMQGTVSIAGFPFHPKRNFQSPIGNFQNLNLTTNKICTTAIYSGNKLSLMSTNNTDTTGLDSSEIKDNFAIWHFSCVYNI